MSQNSSPIVIVDDDVDDLDMFESAYQELEIPNQLLKFTEPLQLVEYLKTTDESPFLIFSDFNMPVLNGLQLRKKLNADSDIKYRSIPFVLWSTSASQDQVTTAYENLVQGYFEKPTTFIELHAKIKAVIQYWQMSLHPKKS